MGTNLFSEILRSGSLAPGNVVARTPARAGRHHNSFERLRFTPIATGGTGTQHDRLAQGLGFLRRRGLRQHRVAGATLERWTARTLTRSPPLGHLFQEGFDLVSERIV